MRDGVPLGGSIEDPWLGHSRTDNAEHSELDIDHPALLSSFRERLGVLVSDGRIVIDQDAADMTEANASKAKP